MTLYELQQLEAELGISLPQEYRQAMLNFPVPACKGNHDTEIWNSAAHLLQENEQLRQGSLEGSPPWPPHFYFIGGGGDGNVHALDLSESNASVWWVEHRNLTSAATQKVDVPFNIWLDEYLAELREDMVGEGIDPSGSPSERERIAAINSWSGGLTRVAAAMLCAAALYAFAAFGK